MNKVRELYRRYWSLIPVGVAVFYIFFYSVWNVIVSPDVPPDTRSYYLAWEHIKAGEIDCFRTPLYPLFIGMMRDLFGYNASLTMVVIIQYILYLLSVWVLTWTAHSLLGANRLIAILGVMPYVSMRIFIAYQYLIITDMLCISFLIFFVYAVLMALRTQRRQYCILTGVLCVMLVFLRPSELCVPFVLLALIPFMVWVVRPSMRADIQILALPACVAVFLAGLYSVGFYRKTGYVGFSSVSAINAVIMDAYTGYPFDPEEFPIHGLFAGPIFLENPSEFWAQWDKLTDSASVDPCFVREELIRAESSEPGFAWWRTKETIVRNMTSDIGHKNVPHYSYLWVILVYVLSLMPLLVRRSRDMISRLLLLLLIFGQMATALMRAPDDYDRLLLMPIVPLMMLCLADMCTRIFDRIQIMRRKK